MQGSFEFPDNPPSFCKVGLGKFEPLIKRKEADNVSVSCHNPLGLNIITCRHPHKQEFIDEVGGLALDIKLSSEIEELPFYIPVLDLASGNIGGTPSYLPTVGLTLSDIISGGAKEIAGMYHEVDQIRFREKMLSSRNFRKRNTILLLTGTDTLIETVWYQRENCKLFESIRNMGFQAVGGMNFSVIEGECAFSHALNQKRSLYSAKLLQDSGSLPIPHIYAVTSHQIERWVKWFSLNPEVRLFTVNCQLQKSDNEISKIITVVKTLLRHFPYLHVLLQGFHFDQLYQFGSLLARIHLADKKPVKFAHMRREIIFDSYGKLKDVGRSQKSKKELLSNNITNRYIFLEALRSKILQRTTITIHKT